MSQQIGKYELIGKIAIGGMAEVFLAKAAGPMGFEKRLVLKRILPHLSDDPSFVEMFLSEAKLAAQLNHPNVVQIFDFGEAEGAYYLAMEYVDGPNLRALIDRARELGRPLDPPVAAKVVSLVCEGLAYAHEFQDPLTGQPLGLIHRDVSPENILISRTGAVKVVDFGIAKAANRGQKTRTGVLKGKLSYMPPEQLRSHSLDLRADVFALGMVLYELLTFERPFDAENEIEVMHAIVHGSFVPVYQRRPDTPQALHEICEAALERDRERRYPSCRQMQADLERFIVSTGTPIAGYQIAQLVGALDVPREWSQPVPRQVRTPIGLTQAMATPLPRTAPEPEPPEGTATQADGPRVGGERATSLRLRPPPQVQRGQPAPPRVLVGLGAAVVVGVTAVILAARFDSSPAESPPEPRLAQVPRSAPARPSLASLRVESVPSGEVRVNGRLHGRSPVTVGNLPPGDVKIEVFDPRAAFSKTVVDSLSPGQFLTRKLILEKAKVEFRIRPGATVFLDGRRLGQTPLEAVEAWEGTHSVRLVNSSLGKDVSVELTVRPGQPNVLEHVLGD